MKQTGILLVAVGVLALFALVFFHMAVVNTLLHAAFFIIIIGVVLYVWGMKRQSKY